MMEEDYESDSTCMLHIYLVVGRATHFGSLHMHTVRYSRPA